MLSAALLAAALPVQSELRLHALFGEGVVLQRECAAPIFGFGEPGSEVRVQPEWSDAEARATVDARGRWRAVVETPKAGGPFTIAVRGASEIVVRDVWIGEVWLCAGQSNMEWRLKPGDLGGVLESEREIASAAHPRIRQFDVANTTALAPQSDVTGRWSACSPETVGKFTAAGYFFARELERELDVPIGLVNATWSGTRIEPWIDAGTATTLAPMASDWARFAELREQSIRLGLPAKTHVDPQAATVIYNGMIAPLAPFELRGFLWYQGESNRENAGEYATLQPAMVDAWRALWGGAKRPFYFVQIAPFEYEDDAGETGALRDAQRLCMRQEATGMVSTMDIGDPADIHPRNKQEVGRRLSLWALAKTYGRTEIVPSGPLFRGVTFDGASALVEFDSIGAGLISAGDHLPGFELAGADKRYFAAQAAIEGERVRVWCRDVSQPVAVRYGYAAASQPILFNRAWLPAAAFRSDSWPIR